MPMINKLTLIGLAAGLLLGCDAGNADQQARDKMNDGRVAAATGNEAGRSNAEKLLKQAAAIPNISQASVAQAKDMLGQVHYDGGLAVLREAQRKDLEVARLTIQIAALGAQLGNSATLVEGYQKRDPQAARADIDKKITEIKGGSGQAKWVGDIATLDTATQKVTQLQGEISKRQGEIKTLDAQRIASLESAEKNSKASEAGKGHEAVDAYKLASGDRKKAADVEARIELLNGQLMPLQRDLDLATAQQQILQTAVSEFQEQSKTLDAGWKEIQSRIQLQKDLITQISSASEPSTQPAEEFAMSARSIAAKAAILSQILQTADKSREQGLKLIQNASDEFQAAFNAANKEVVALSQLLTDKPAVGSVATDVQAALSPQIYKLRYVTAERILGEANLEKAAGISARIKLRTAIAPLMQQAGQTVPREIADAALDQQLKTALAESGSHFKEASDHIGDVLESAANNSIAKSTRKAAAISKIFILNGEEQLALLQGDKNQAEKAHAAAIAAVKEAVEDQSVFPSLPGDLASALPAPPPPTSEPAVEEDASSPDVQAIHTALTAFLDALEKGDMDGAKAVSQIESGQDDEFNQVASLISARMKLNTAIRQKFGDDAVAKIAGPDLAAMMKDSKVTVKDDAAYLIGDPTNLKRLVKVDGQWKIYFGEADENTKVGNAMMAKFAEALNGMASDVEAGKYAAIDDLNKAMTTAMIPGTPPTTEPAPAPQ